MVCLVLATSSLSIFNKVALVLDEFLAEQGGKHLVPVGLGNDDQCIEDDFTSWREMVWPKLDKLLMDEDDITTVSTPYTAAIREYRVVFHDSSDALAHDKSWSHANGDTTPDSQHPSRYETGDHVGVYSENSIECVEEVERLLGYSADTFFSIHLNNEDGTPRGGSLFAPPFPSPCTLRTTLTLYADLLNFHKKATLMALAAHPSNPTEAERLKFLASPAGRISMHNG